VTLQAYPKPTTRSLSLHKHVRNGYPLLLPPSFGRPCIPQSSHLHNNAPREPSLPSSLIISPSLENHPLLRPGLLGVLPVNTGRIRTSSCCVVSLRAAPYIAARHAPRSCWCMQRRTAILSLATIDVRLAYSNLPRWSILVDHNPIER
jgi:hypothetical protein